MRTLPVSISIINWSFHAEQPWQNMNENPPDPWSHCVSFWGAEMYIENNHGDANTATNISGSRYISHRISHFMSKDLIAC